MAAETGGLAKKNGAKAIQRSPGRLEVLYLAAPESHRVEAVLVSAEIIVHNAEMQGKNRRSQKAGDEKAAVGNLDASILGKPHFSDTTH